MAGGLVPQKRRGHPARALIEDRGTRSVTYVENFGPAVASVPRKATLIAFFLIALFLASGTGRAEEARKVLRVGIHEKPPYATKENSGEWNGIAVDLWNSIALQTGLRFEFVETPYQDIIPDVASGKLDAAVGEIEITTESEKIVDFTQPYLMSSIGIALQSRTWHLDWITIAKEFFNWTLVQVLLAILAGMVVVSALIWLLERNHERGHFRGGLTGFGSALWFSAATMTSVGYGDKTPSTLPGRLVSFVWMLAGVLLVAGFTAVVAANVASARINESITRPSDLYRVSCGVMANSVSLQYLQKQGIPSRPYPSIAAALEALSKGEIEAVLADRNSLRYLAKSMAGDRPDVRFRVSSVSFQDVFIGIPVHDKLPEFEDINVALLNTRSSEKWQGTLRHWLGRDRE
jgi:ABC-type amino acid transport substrate-binding protein